MDVLKNIIKKFLKITAWTAAIIILLLVTIILLIQVPAVQNAIVQKVTSYLEKKTHAEIGIKRIGISFPKSVFVEGLLVRDLSKDTLVYAGEAKVNIDMIALIRSNIHLKSVALTDVVAKLNRPENDSAFNFNFLITAFSDSTKQKEAPDTAAKKTNLAVDNVELKNIRFIYDDNYTGIYAAAAFDRLNLTVDELDPDQQIYKADELSIDQLRGKVLIRKEIKSTESTTTSRSPVVSANRIVLKNSNFTFRDFTSKQSVIAFINNFKLSDAAVDLNTQHITMADLSLAKSNIGISMYEKPRIAADSIIQIEGKQKGWNVTVQKVDLKDNTIAYNIVNKPEIPKVFDASHINYQQVSLSAKNIYYSADTIRAKVLSCSATDSTYFVLKEFQADFFMNKNSIQAKGLVVKTSNSSIKASVTMNFASLEQLKDSIQNLGVTASLKKTTIHTRDVLYFSPGLIRQPFFRGAANSVTVSGNVSGTVGDLKGDHIFINTASKTAIAANFRITGLPDAETAYFDVPDLKVTTGKKDLVALLGNELLPTQISLPENMSVQGRFKGRIREFAGALSLKSDFGDVDAEATIDKSENFKATVQTTKFDLGALLNDKKMYGPVTINADVKGKGFTKNTINAQANVDVPEFYMNQYTYHKLKLTGNVSGQEFDGDIHLDDPNAEFDFKGLVSMKPGSEKYKFSLDLKGADLQKLKLVNDDFKIALTASSDLQGSSIDSINGDMGINKIVVVHHENKYVLDSMLFASINKSDSSSFRFSSALVGIRYDGTFAPTKIVSALKKCINTYFPIDSIAGINSTDSIAKNDTATDPAQRFNFQVQLHNHPIISEVFLPQLTEFEPGLISGKFDGATNTLTVSASVEKLTYGSVNMKKAALLINTDSSALNYKVGCAVVSNEQAKLENFTLYGKMANQKATVNIISMDSANNKKIAMQTTIVKEQNNYKLVLDPNTFYLADEQWRGSDDNYILFGKEGFLIHHFVLSKLQSELAAESVNDKFNDDLHVSIKNFQLEDLSRIFEKDTNLVRGVVQGDVQLKRVNNSYGIIADASINDLAVKEIPVGNITLKAENTSGERFNVDMTLKGAQNDVVVNGYYIPKDSLNALSFNVDIKSLSAKTIEAFSMNQVTETEGGLHGHLTVKGNTSKPDVAGSLTFDNMYAKPAILNSRILLQNQTIEISPNAITFNSFTIADRDKNTAVIDGSVKMNHFSNFNFALELSTKNFLLLNTTAKNNKEFYGVVLVDSKISVKGTPEFPVVNSRIKLKDRTSFTFAIPETKLTTDKGDNVVEFEDLQNPNSILYRTDGKQKTNTGFKNFDISSTIEIDKKATLRLLMDPSSSDSLVVRGEAALSLVMDPSGKISLTGAYNLNEGSYLVSLENVVKKKFAIEPGSTIVWNGDPLDADININAIYTIRTSPIELVAEQVSGLSESDKSGYRQRYEFLIYLKLRGALMKPEVSFEIQLPPEDKGILNGAVNAKLMQLNEDPSSLNKQVFGLLVLNRFIQEDPLQSETGGVSSAARTTVGKLLSAQLNQLGSKVIPGVELNFDVQSYDDYTTGEAQGRTEVEVGIKKQLFNERLTVQVGGSVDVEGEKAKENSASDITGDLNMEYKLTKDGRYRLKGFRHSQQEEAIEGKIIETGAGIMYVRDFNKWRELFRKPKDKKTPVSTPNDTTNSK